ncbi:MAG: hypothetical protein HY530_00850 [Chloroflexi bacterium]|nr:hypothetical protein [Chloroflexota bacterium]
MHIDEWVHLAFSEAVIRAGSTTFVGLVLVLAPYILLNLKGDFKHSLGLTLALLIPFLAPFPWIFSLLEPAATAVE